LIFNKIFAQKFSTPGIGALLGNGKYSGV